MLCRENKGADQLQDYFAANPHLWSRIYAKSRYSHDVAHLKNYIKI